MKNRPHNWFGRRGEEIQSLQSVLQAIASHVTHSNTLGHLSDSNIIKMIMTLTMMIMMLIIITIIIPLWRNNINSQLDATIIILLIISISSTCFGR